MWNECILDFSNFGTENLVSDQELVFKTEYSGFIKLSLKTTLKKVIRFENIKVTNKFKFKIFQIGDYLLNINCNICFIKRDPLF